MDSSNTTRAGRLLDQVSQDLDEDYSSNGLPEFQGFPKLLSQYAGIPRSLKMKRANAGHIMVLAEGYGELAKEVEKLRKVLEKARSR
ncbi:MAG: hypothetical protein ACLP5H_08880 [Desulfomonilaceae bacterium]